MRHCPRSSVLTRLARIALTAALGALLLATALVLLFERAVPALEALADGRFHLGLAALFLGIVCLAQRMPWRASVACGVAVLHLTPALPTRWGGDPAPAPDAPRLSAATANLWYGNEHAELLLAFVREAKPELLALQEISPFMAASLDALREDYPHRALHGVTLDPGGSTFGIGLLSRHPLREHRVIDSGPGAIPLVRAVVEAPGGAVVAIVVHALPPQRSIAARQRLFDTLAGVIDPALATVVLGDFNATLYTPAFRDLLAHGGLRDARDRRWRRPTWAPRRWPWMLGFDIDHVLVSTDLTVIDWRVGPPIGSDHRPVITHLARTGRR